MFYFCQKLFHLTDLPCSRLIVRDEVWKGIIRMTEGLEGGVILSIFRRTPLNLLLKQPVGHRHMMWRVGHHVKILENPIVALRAILLP